MPRPARLEGLAEPDCVVVSGSVYDQVRSKVEFRFDELGPQEIKNIAEPVRAYRTLADGNPSRQAQAGSELPPSNKPSIAGLPFANLSGDPQQEPFADGITEDLITDNPVFEAARNAVATVEKHLERILERWTSNLSNARLEAFNGLFQAARARARGYRNIDTSITMIYLIAAPIEKCVKST